MNDDLVQITFIRRWAFAGALLLYTIYVNGNYVGKLKNGRTLIAHVPKSETYYIDEGNAYYERNAILKNNNSDKIDIMVKRVGGWRIDSYNEYYLLTGAQLDNIPSFNYDKYSAACWNDELFSQLNDSEKILTTCLEFEYEIADGIDQVLTSEHCMQMIDALRIIGAKEYIEVIDRVINAFFSGDALPLGDDAWENNAIRVKLKEANKMISEAEKMKCAYGDFHHAVIKHILKHFI